MLGKAAGIIGVLVVAYGAIIVHDSFVRKEALADARREALLNAVKVVESKKDSISKLTTSNLEKDKKLAEQDSKLRKQAQKLVAVQSSLEDSIAQQKQEVLRLVGCEPAVKLVNSYEELNITLKERITNLDARLKIAYFRFDAMETNFNWSQQVVASQDTLIHGMALELKRKSHGIVHKVWNTALKIGIGYGLGKATK